MKIMLATPCFQGVATMDYMQCLLTETLLNPDRLLQQQRYNILPYFQKGYSGLGKDRGTMASYALKLGCDKIIFIDSDQAWTWNDLKKILDSEKQIVAGVIPLKKMPQVLNFTPLMEDMDAFEDEGKEITPVGLRRLRQKYHGQDEIEVEMTGTGFLSVDRSVLEALSKTCDQFLYYDPHTQTKQIGWDFFPSGAMGGVYMGEDWGHCIIAKRAGFKIYINSSVFIDHVGNFTYRVDRKEVLPNGA